MIRLVSCLAVLLAASPSFALLRVAAPPGVPTRTATADLVITGQVTAIEKDEVEVEPYPGSKQKVSYRVAVVKVADALTGGTGETHVKVGFQPTGGVGRGRPTFDVKDGAEGLFFLKRQAAGIYTFDYATSPVDAKAEGYKADLEAAKKTVAVFADPTKALRAKADADRYFAAAVLVARYRTPPAGGGKTEPVSAEESKLIFKTIQEADWSKADTGVPAPYQTFTRLGLTAADKWQPAQFQGNGDFNAHMKAEVEKWLAGDGADYRIKKYVPAKK